MIKIDPLCRHKTDLYFSQYVRLLLTFIFEVSCDGEEVSKMSKKDAIFLNYFKRNSKKS